MDLVRNSLSQVILTTHSPYLLDHAKPEVFLVEKEDLETKVEMLSNTERMNRVKLFLEEDGTLGEAWYSGLLGGTPFLVVVEGSADIGFVERIAERLQAAC